MIDREIQRLEEGKMRRIVGILLVMVLVSTLVACIAIGSGGEKVNHQPTLGQQLIDLQTAKDEGAISQQEYGELKDKLKKSYD